jgi:2-polyprenyl-3-methyl-5-hydroxy-6-metoxy-1,4-benzoquinol methylase
MTQLFSQDFREDVFDCIDALGRFDLVILGDVIEHFEKEKRYVLVNKLLEHTDNIILSTPNGFMPQGAWAQNEFERHKSGWTVTDLSPYTVVEHQIVRDTLYSDILANIPSFPDHLKNPASLLVG